MAKKIKTTKELQNKSNEIREKVINYHKRTGRGHVGSNLSPIEILTTLYYGFMQENDSFILSKGHASSILYVVLNDRGLIPNGALDKLEEHPKLKKEYGINASTGSLGHGLSIGLGMAFADPMNNVYVLLGDGECDEGQVWEAARLAKEINIKNLTAIVDCNGFQGFKNTDYSSLGNKFKSFGWYTLDCDGHDCKDILESLKSRGEYPRVLLAKTIKGKGISEIEAQLRSHYFHFPGGKK